MDTNSSEIKKFAQSTAIKRILRGLAVLILVLLIFQAGMFVGYRKASFAYRSGDNYQRMFNGHRAQFFGGMGMRGEEFSNAHGSIGKIVSIILPTLMVEDRDGVEKVVLLKNDTDIRRFRDTIKAEELKTGDVVIVIGTPNDKAQIEAKFIRLMPSPSVVSTTNAVNTEASVKTK